MTQPEERYDPDSALHSWDDAVFLAVEDEPPAVTAALSVSPYHGAFCRNPLHPGPCKGWRSKQRNTSTGKTAKEEPSTRARAKRQPTTPAAATPPKIVKPIKEIGVPSRYGKVKGAVPAAQMEKDWRAHNDTLNGSQESAVRAYSGTSYTSMNDLLRGKISEADMKLYKAFYDKIEVQARDVQSAMAPAPKGTLAFRGMRSDALGLGANPTEEQILGLVDHVLVNDAFTSTTVDPYAAFSGDVQLEIEVPKGAPSLWMNGNSGIPGEQELLLAAGSKMKVLSVEVEDGWYGRSYKVKGRIVP